MVKDAVSLLRRLVGATLILLVVVPFWKLLAAQGTPISLEAVRLTDTYALLLLQGTAVVLIVAAVAAFLMSPDAIEQPFLRFAATLESWHPTKFAIAIATLSGVLAVGFSWYVWDLQPVLIDSLAQAIHARYLAAGMLAGPRGIPYEFWVSANTLVTDQGWVSQYPPGQIVALAIGFAVNAVWLVCPLLMAVAVFFTSLTADRLFPDDKVMARTGSLMFACSPFLIGLAAAYMSHVTVAALLSVAGYCALRARDDHWIWALWSGVAVSAAFATRSLSAIMVGPVLLVGIWLFGYALRERPLVFLRNRLLVAFLGGLPILLAIAAYNAHFFGSPFEFGYTAYLGANHGLGYHPDPFGNVFGPTEGLAYTSSDLTALGYFLLRTPISVMVIVGLYLVVAKRLSNGGRLVTAWALCLVLPHAAYWHHDLLLGPRMISETAPAWCLLASLAGFGLVRALPTDKKLLAGRFSPRVFAGSALIFSIMLGAGYFLPRDVRNYANTFGPGPAPPRANVPTLLFVHGSWDGRIVAKLLAGGMRADSVNVALTINSTCSLHEFAETFAGHNRNPSSADTQLSFTPGVTDGSVPTRLETGVLIRARQDRELSAPCVLQATSDRGGAVPLMPLLWQGDLPGIPGAGVMFARDLGPTDNARLIARYPGRRVGVVLRHPEEGTTAIMPYEEAMTLLWGVESADSTGS